MTEITIQDNGDGTGTVTISGVPITPYVAPIVAPPSNPAPSAPTITGQTLTADKTEIHVGDTFTVSGVLNYSDGTTKPVTGYRLYGYDKSILVAKTSSTPTFMAIAAGATTIKNDNLGTTAKLDVTVLAADTAPPSDPPPADNPPPVSPPPPATSSVPTDVPSVIADGLSILYHYPMDATLAAAVDTVEIPGAFGGSPEVVQKIAWNFGDGSNGFGADGRHPYDKPGAYTITGSVNYRDGRIVPFGQLTVQVGSNA